MLRPATLLLLITLAFGWAAAGAHAAPYSAHSLVQSCCTPFAQKKSIFAEAKAMGARYIRLDVSLEGTFEHWGAEAAEPNWKGVDEVARLARRYGLRVAAVINGTPSHISSCEERRLDYTHCAPTDPEQFGEYAARVVARAPDVFRAVEVWNEPEAAWTFQGTPEQYAGMLKATYSAVKRRFPGVKVLIGGATSLGSRDWYARALAAGAAGSFDIANVHVRGPVTGLAPTIRRWRRFFREHGHSGPLWVTEAGYPSDTSAQYDERYRGGEAAQAAYLRDALPAMVGAGACQVFVIERDAWVSEWGNNPMNTEGVVQMAEREPFPARRKPAFGVVRRLAASARPRACGRGRCRAGGPCGRPTSRRARARSSSRESR
jgi:polysaccharide biosynthesis protein PslG